MQFHRDGFRPGDPEVATPVDRVRRFGPDGVEEVDVLIVGCGPAGLVLAAQLSVLADISTKIVERKPGPLQMGQADGIACRTVEMFEAFGFSEQILKEAYWVNETVFWGPDAQDPDRIARSGRVQDVEDGISEFPHVIVNQARVHDHLLETMRRSATRLEPDYGVTFEGLTVAGDGSHPVTVTLRRDDGTMETMRSAYVVGCDGARSAVRSAIGCEMTGDRSDHAWGVMDVLAVTDFPDIRFKAAIQSADAGNILLIPREGGYLIRIYVELGSLADPAAFTAKDVTLETLIEATQRILLPYTFETKEVAWWSVYEVGQRLVDRFDDVPSTEQHSRLPRVFIAGDACHTHSAKAGQGMNVSMQDTFNLGWKLAAVLRGVSDPNILHTYTEERQLVAQELIDFDKRWSELMSAPVRSASHPEGVTPEELKLAFVTQGRYTAGTATRYTRHSRIRGTDEEQERATGFPIGMRFQSAPVIRIADAKPVQLGHVARADGRWRLYAFADAAHPLSPGSGLRDWCEWIDGADSPIRRITPQGWDIDAVVDVRTILQQGPRELTPMDLPEALRPATGRLGLVDYEKAFCADPSDDIFDRRGIDRENGCLVLVRPDQYVAAVVAPQDHTRFESLLSGIFLPQSGSSH